MYTDTPKPWLLKNGEKVLDWVILRPLGRGGMGEVYLVQRHDQPSFPYALKLFTGDHTSSDFFKQRFFSLGEMLLQMAHPSLAKLLYLGTLHREHQDLPFVVMTFIGMNKEAYSHLLDTSHIPSSLTNDSQSYSLADILSHPSGITLAWLERWFQELSEALRHLHAAGFAHGDIKPTNILIDATGRAILIDFGLASALTPDAPILPPGYETTLDALQSSTLFRGTPAFVAPEILAGSKPSEASDWYSLGATFFFARTGVHYCPNAPTRMLINTMESPWKERFLQLLHSDPTLRCTPLPLSSNEHPVHKRHHTHPWRLLVVALLSSLLTILAFIFFTRENENYTCDTLSLDNTCPLTLLAREERHLVAQTCTLPHLQMGPHAHLTIDIPANQKVSLETCDIHPDATLTITGAGELSITRNDTTHLEGAIHLTDTTTLSIYGYNQKALPKIITSPNTKIIAELGNNQRSYQLFETLDMRHGGSFTGYGIRFYIGHNATKTILLGNDAVVDLPWVAYRGAIHATSGNNILRGVDIHLWHTLWLATEPNTTLTITGDRFYMFDHWRGEDLYITKKNQGTIIFDFREFAPLCGFHCQSGTTLLRCDMTQDLEKNWCTRKHTADWNVHSAATLAGNSTLTFAPESQLIVHEKATLLAGENGSGALSINRATLHKEAVLKTPGNTSIHIDELTITDPITLDLTTTTHAAPFTWTKLIGDPAKIRLLLPPGSKNTASITTNGVTLYAQTP